MRKLLLFLFTLLLCTGLPDDSSLKSQPPHVRSAHTRVEKSSSEHRPLTLAAQELETESDPIEESRSEDDELFTQDFSQNSSQRCIEIDCIAESQQVLLLPNYQLFTTNIPPPLKIHS